MVQLRNQGDCHSWKPGGGGQASQRPVFCASICYFELAESLPLGSSAQPCLPLHPHTPQSIWSSCCVLGTVPAPGEHPHQRRQRRFRVPLQWASDGHFFPACTLLLVLEGEGGDVSFFLRPEWSCEREALHLGGRVRGQPAVGLAVRGILEAGRADPSRHRRITSLEAWRPPARREAEGTREDTCGLASQCLGNPEQGHSQTETGAGSSPTGSAVLCGQLHAVLQLMHRSVASRGAPRGPAWSCCTHRCHCSLSMGIIFFF